MKLTFLIVLLFCFNASASLYAQKITLGQKKAPLKKVLREIEAQSGYTIIYENELLQQAQPVTLSLNKVTLTDALDACFKSQLLTYTIIDKTVVLKARPKSVLQKVIELLTVPQTIKGKVTDSTGMPLPGATIRIKGRKEYYSAKANGEFIFEAVPGDMVSVSFVGYLPYTFIVTESQPFQNIILYQASNKLNEVAVVSTGYQEVPKERATGSFATPNKQMYEARVATDVISKLDGITSGLVFNSPGITGTQAPKLSIRGRSTIYANDNPLIVVDNFPYDGDINNINPNDIATITVLKDAAAASIWGVQAGNGVIVITTRRGKSNKPLKVEFNSNFTISQKPNLYYDKGFLDASNFIEVEKFLFKNGKYDTDILLNEPSDISSNYPALSPVVALLDNAQKGLISRESADAQIEAFKKYDVRGQISRHFYRPAFNQQYALNLSGGSDKATYYFSGGYDKNLQNLVGSKLDRITINTQNTFSPLKKLLLSVGVNYVQNNTAADNTLERVNTIGTYSTIYPYAQLTDPTGASIPVLNQYATAFVKRAQELGYLDWQFNPLDELRNRYNTTKNQVNDLRLTTGINYNFWKGFSADVKYQYQKNASTGKNLATQESYYARDQVNRLSIVDPDGRVIGYNLPVGGILVKDFNSLDSHHARGTLSYNYNSSRHQISAIAGAELTQVRTEGNGLYLYGYNDELGTSQPVDSYNVFPVNPGAQDYAAIAPNPSAGGTLDRFRSYFANTGYTYLDRYTFSASGRIDASNYFGVRSNQKAVPLWSAGAKWDMHKEPFYHLTWLPVLKLRGSYGYQGNLDRTLAAVPTFSFGGYASFTNAPEALLRNVGNSDLRWEKTRMINIGLDFALVQNRISGSFEYYSKKGTDLIGFTVLAPSSGVTNMKGNYSGTSGKGIDVQINSENLTGKFKWNTSVLFNWARDRVSLYTGTDVLASGLVGRGYNITPVVGMPAYSLYSFKWGKLDPLTGDPQGFDASGVISKNYGALVNPETIGEIEYSGSARPVTFGGIYNRFSYRTISLSFNISYKLGYVFRRTSLSYSQLFNSWVGHQEYAMRWQKTGDEGLTDVPSQVYPASRNRDLFYQYSSATVEKGDHIRLQDITLSYDLSRERLSRLPFERVQLYGYANNIGILWKANNVGIDPDFPYAGLPTPRTYALGIKLFF